MRALSLLLLLVPVGLCAEDIRPTPRYWRDEGVKQVYWVFLNKGKVTAASKGLDQKAVAEMQQKHVGNFGDLAKAGKCLMAGPLGDNGFIRGIVVLDVKSKTELDECFKPDPFVQNGLLDVEAYPWTIDTRFIGRPKEPFEMAQYTMGIIMKGSEYSKSSAKSLDKLIPSLAALKDSADIAFYGPIEGGGDKLGIVFFHNPDQKALEEKIARDFGVRAGFARLEMHPQWLAKGSLAPIVKQ